MSDNDSSPRELDIRERYEEVQRIYAQLDRLFAGGSRRENLGDSL